MIKAKKKFGQNFLQDGSIKQKIVESMPKNERILVEIGPGLGDLTQKLLEVKPLIAYEVDSDLCVYLRKKFTEELSEKRLKLIEQDVLEVYKSSSLCDEAYDLVANLPYYIATTIILQALRDSLCMSMVVMVQKEVAQKFAATSGEKEFSSLAILAQSIADVQILFDVPPQAFDPQPKVHSSVLFIKKSKQYIQSESSAGLFLEKKELHNFEKYLKIAFSAPRKMWLKNIASHFCKIFASTLLNELGYTQSIRPHEISVSNHHLLFQKLQGKNDGRKQRGNQTS